MNPSDALRKIIPHAVIAIGACIGAWMFLVEPKLETLAELEAAQQTDALDLTPEQWYMLGEHVKTFHNWTEEIETANDISRDSNRLFNIVMELADAHHVDIVSLQPGQRIGRAGNATRSRDNDEAAAITRLDVIATGQYENVAAFLGAVAEISAFIRPHALQLSPMDDGPPPTVSARLTCDVLAFDIPKRVAQLKGTDHVH